MRILGLLCVGTILLSSPGEADNLAGSLAIHLVASDDYLDCEDLCPTDMTCMNVNCDLTLAELEASGGYGYAAFLAYNVDNVTTIELYIVGWPIGPGTPDFLGPHYCGEEAVVFGEPFEKRGGVGGVLALSRCESPCSHMFCFCKIAFGPSVCDWLPITLAYEASRFSYPGYPHNYFVDCTIYGHETSTIHEHCAVIGGECQPIPNCEPGPTAGDQTTWGRIKSLY